MYAQESTHEKKKKKSFQKLQKQQRAYLHFQQVELQKDHVCASI